MQTEDAFKFIPSRRPSYVSDVKSVVQVGPPSIHYNSIGMNSR